MTLINAPLTEPVLGLLQSQLLNIVCTAPMAAGEPIEEQYLLYRLGLKLQTDTGVTEDLARFQHHFILYHLLYRLQQQLLECRQGYLRIDLAKVQLLALSQTPAADNQDGRRQYYMNWQNFYLMTEQLLEQHLNAFWQHFTQGNHMCSAVSHAQAVALLQLPDDFCLNQLKKAYRTLALQHHPDRGGSPEQFILLRQAYQQLLQLF